MFPFELLNLSLGFRKHFDIEPALTEERARHAYAIRHRVYCEELGFEPVRPERLERDEYDARSAHVLVRSLREDRFVACARLVRCDPAEPESELPLERLCESAIDRAVLDPRRLDRRTVGEISRLAIVPEFRRRKGEHHTAFAVSEADFGRVDLPRFPYIQVSLYLGIIALARQSGVNTLLVLTEPRLAGHFKKLGVPIAPIGRPVEHRGTRAPSMMKVSDVERGLPRSVRPLYELIDNAIHHGRELAGVA